MELPTMSILFLLIAATLSLTEAFVIPENHASKMRSTEPLFMAPRYDKTTDKWVASSAEEGPGAGYGITKTLLLHGPEPFFQRVFKPDDYEQAVLKFMAGDKCSRDEAQGNMDKYLNNPADWQFERLEMQKKGVKYDYVTLRAKDAALTVAWAAIVLAFGGRLVYALASGVNFWDLGFGPFDGSH